MKIKFGKPVIYLCNHDPRQDMNPNDVLYYDMNVIYVTLSDDDYFFEQ